jgi:tetratricopeptide (TPR) repeat protein
MDFLKKILAISLLFFTMAANSQEFEKQLKAFENSYASEYSGAYGDAIKSITAVYKAESYEMNLRLAWLYYASKNYNEACNYYQKSFQLFPLSIEARLGFANAAAELGNWTQVETQYMEILKTDAMNTTANYRMGLICYNRLDYTSALKYFTKTMNQFPFDYDTSIMVAWTELKLGKLREAKIMFQKTLFIRPSDASALEGLALIK